MPDTPGSAAPNSVPVPQRLAAAPVAAGMVVPYITMTHRDPAKPVWGAVNPARLQQIWQHSLCQVCGQRLDSPWVVVYIRPWDYLRGIGPEPALHPECGLYSKRTCPMLVFRRFANSEGRAHRNRRTGGLFQANRSVGSGAGCTVDSTGCVHSGMGTAMMGTMKDAQSRKFASYRDIPGDIDLISDNGGDTWGRNGQIADVDGWPENNYFAPFTDASAPPIRYATIA